MDFHSMKRKELQCLCKKNKIPANLSNLEMANKLTTLFKERENPITRGLIRGQDENESEAECNVVLERKAKKVRFSPEHELIEFTRSREKKRRSKRTSVFCENTLTVENVDQASLRKGNIDCSVRVTQSRGKNSVDGVQNVTKRGRKNVKSDSNIDSKAVNDADNERIPEEVIDGPRRVTRSRGQKLMEGLVGEEKRRRNNLGNGDKNDKAGLVSGKDNGITMITRRSYRNRGVVDEGKLARDSGVNEKNHGKGREQQVLEGKRTSEENMIVAPQILSNKKKDLHIEEPVKLVLRRSNRGNSVLPLHDELGNNEFTVVNKDRCSLRNSELQLGTIGGISENDEKVTQSAGVMRRSSRTTLSLKSVPTDEKADTTENPGTAQQLREPCPMEKGNPLGQEKMRRSGRNVSKYMSSEILDEPGEAVVRQQKNKGRKHKRCPVPEENVGKSDNDPRPLTRSMRGPCRNDKTSSEAAINKIDDQTEALCRSQELNLLEDSSLKGLLTIGVSVFADAQLSVSGVSESSGNSALSSNTSAKNVTGNIRLTSSRKHHKKEQDTSTADGSEVKSVHDKELGTLDEDPTSRITNLPADCTDCENGISDSKTMVVDKVQILMELDEQEIVEKNISKNDPNEPAAQVFCRQETFNCVYIIDNQEQSDASNVSVETSSSSDSLELAALEVTEVEADKNIQPSSVGADDGKIKSISVNENLEPFEPECINEMPFPTECHVDVHLEVTMAEGDKNTRRSSSVVDYGKIKYISVRENLEPFEPECINELTLPTECHVDVLNQLEASDTTHKVGEAGAFEPCEGQISPTESMSTFKQKEPSSGKLRRGLDADHKAEGGRFFVHKMIHSELAESDEARYTKDVKSTSNEDVEFGLSILFDGESSAKIFPQDREMCFDEYSIKDSTEQGIVHDPLATVPTSMFVNSTESKLGRGLETVNVAEGDETYGHKGVYQELTETKAGGCLKDPMSASDEERAYTVSTPFDGQRSASNMPQDAGILSGACSIKDSGDQGMFCDTIAMSPTSNHAKSSENKLSADLEEHHISEDADLEDHHISEGETHFSKDVHPESGETGCRYLRYHNSTSDDDRELSMFNLLDDERNEWITSQDVGIFSRKYSIKDSDEQGFFRDSQDTAPPTMYANCTENKFSPGSSSLLDINWPGPESVSKSQGSCATSFGTCPISETEAGVSKPTEEKETTISESKIPGDEMSMDETIRQHEISNQDYESSNIGICEPEQPKSPLAEHVATSNNSEVQEDWNGGSKTTVNAMSIFKYNIKGEIACQAVDKAENQMQNPIATAAKSVKEKENFADAQSLDVAESMDDTISKLGIESQRDWKLQDIEEHSKLQDIEEAGDLSQNLIAHEALSNVDEDLTDVEFNQSWQEIDLNNLFETIVDIVTPSEANQTSSHASEIENSTMSMNKCIASSGCGSLTEKDIEMEEERGREDEETTNKNLVLPIACKEESDVGFKVGREEHRLRSPFATPIKIVVPCQVVETSYEKYSEKATLSIVECVGAIEENVVNQTKSNEKVEDAENELENTSCIENLLLPNGAVISNEQRNKVDGVELANIYSSTVLSEGAFDGNEEQWIEDTDKCMEESNSRAEENDKENIFSVGLSFFDEEAIDNDSKSTEKNVIIPSVSQENLYEVEGCNIFLDCNLSGNLSYRNRVYVESEGKIRQSSGSACSETDDDLQKANVLEDSCCFTDYHEENSFLRGSSSDPYGQPLNPKVANVGMFNGEKNVVIHKDTPSILSKASHEDDEVTERKDTELTRDEDELYGANIWDDTDDNLRSCNEFFGEQHINSEMTVLESHFDGYTPCQEAKVLSSNDELQSTCREMTMPSQSGDNIIPTAENGSIVCGNESDVLCNLAKYPFVGDDERGDSEKSGPRTTNFGLEGDQEDGGEVEDNSSAEIGLPQIIISELHLEEKVGDFTSNILTVTDTPVFECDEIFKKSYVADTTKQHIDSESSLAVIDDSGTDRHTDVLTRTVVKMNTENASLAEPQVGIDRRLAYTDGKDEPSLKTESEELEEPTLFMEPDEGSAVNSKDGRSSVSKLCSTAKNNARIILIHGTPKKLLRTADMKENAPKTKRSQIGDFTTMRPAKRRALQDVRWKY